MWESYYNYYYNDGTKPGSVLQGAPGGSKGAGTKSYNDRNIYQSSISGDDDWGFSGKSKAPFFKNITVFGFHQHEFTAYTLINPIITSFSHDSYSYSEGNGTMTNKMSIDYETVVYNYGSMDGRDPGNIVTGFGDVANYDRELSPIANADSNSSALGNGGLVPAKGGFISSPAAGNPGGAAATAGDVYNSFANPNLKVAIPATINSLLVTSEQNTPTNRNAKFNIPVAAASPGPAGLAAAPPIGALTMPPNPVFTIPNAGKQYSGPPDVFTGFPPAPPFSRV